MKLPNQSASVIRAAFVTRSCTGVVPTQLARLGRQVIPRVILGELGISECNILAWLRCAEACLGSPSEDTCILTCDILTGCSPQ